MKKILTLLFALVLCIGANAAQLNLADVINKVLTEQKPANGYYAVVLDSNNEYVLNSQINLGQNKVAIWGSAIVKVEGDGQIATQTYFAVNGVSFDLAAANKAPLALEAVTKETLPEVFTMADYPGATRDVPHYDYKYSIFNCNFANVKNGIFYDNAKSWAIQAFEISNCIIQIDDDAKRTFEEIGAIQALIMKNNTVYSVKGTKQQFIRFNNPNNSRPTYNWGTEARGHFILKDNTFYNITKDFGNNVPSYKLNGVPTITVTAKGNIFYNTFRFISKFVQTNSARDFTASDNIEFSNNPSVNIENYGTQVDPGFTAPTVALDLNNPAALKACFATELAAGSPAWCKTAFYSKVNKSEGQNHETLNLSNVLTLKPKAGANKHAINDALYPWITYKNNTSSVDDGTAEVSRGGAYTKMDINTGALYPADAKFPDPWDASKELTGGCYVWDDAHANMGAIKVDSREKAISFNMTNVTKVSYVLTGGGSKTNIMNAIVLNALSGDTVQVVTSEPMPGKSNNVGASNPYLLKVENLDPTVKYIITLETADVENGPAAVYVLSALIHGEDLSVAKSYHVKGANYESEKGKANYEVISTQDFLSATKMPKRDEITKNVYALREDCSWVEYINETSPLLYGGYEVSAGNRMTSVDLFTAEPTDNPQMLPATDGSWLGGYPTIETTKKLVIRLNNTSDMFEPLNVRFIFTGAGSNANKAKVLIQNEYMDDDFETENMPGKSQKANQTNSCVVERMLFAPGKYTITVSAVEGSSALCALHITNDWDFEYTPANELGETNGIENVETVKPASRVAYNIAGQRVANNAKGLIIVNGNKYINK